MGKTSRITKEIFVSRSIASHPGKMFDYSKSVINGTRGNTDIICGRGHQFSQSINEHMRGLDCPYCTGVKMNTPSFVDAANIVHGFGVYDYTFVDFTKSCEKVKIVCSRNGHEFWQTPNSHLSGRGCRKCSDKVTAQRQLKDREVFIRECQSVQKECFDYSKVVYLGDREDVGISCPNGHTFWQMAGNHLKGVGCPSCMKSGYRKSLPGSIYLMGSGSLTKIGITNRAVSRRLYEINKSGLDFSLLFSAQHDAGAIPWAIEWSMKKYLQATHKSPETKFDGSTECFIDADREDLIRMIKQSAINMQGMLCQS